MRSATHSCGSRRVRHTVRPPKGLAQRRRDATRVATETAPPAPGRRGARAGVLAAALPLPVIAARPRRSPRRPRPPSAGEALPRGRQRPATGGPAEVSPSSTRSPGVTEPPSLADPSETGTVRPHAAIPSAATLDLHREGRARGWRDGLIGVPCYAGPGDRRPQRDARLHPGKEREAALSGVHRQPRGAVRLARPTGIHPGRASAPGVGVRQPGGTSRTRSRRQLVGERANPVFGRGTFPDGRLERGRPTLPQLVRRHRRERRRGLTPALPDEAVPAPVPEHARNPTQHRGRPALRRSARTPASSSRPTRPSSRPERRSADVPETVPAEATPDDGERPPPSGEPRRRARCPPRLPSRDAGSPGDCAPKRRR